jgi:4-diphosphocytidyl-2C-methyl-D-erythritol kinase
LLFPFGCETKQVFKAYQQSNPIFSPCSEPFKNDSLSRDTLMAYLKGATNDLEPIVSTLYPPIGLALEKLRKTQAIYAGLSGSGATCYAVFDSVENLKKTSQELHNFFRTHNCKSILAETFLTQ